MDSFLFFGTIIIVILFIIGIPIGLTIYFYRYLNRNYSNKYLKFLAFIPTLLLVYFVWISIYPDEDFYKTDYKEVTQIEFPKNSKFKYKSATFPDHFGDYTSVFMFETSETEIKKLKEQLKKIKFEEVKLDNLYSPETDIAIEKTNAKISHQFMFEGETSKNYYVCFFDDNKTVLIRRLSW